jgi:hypothetical protein
MNPHSIDAFRRRGPTLGFLLFSAAGALGLAQGAAGEKPDKPAAEAAFLAENTAAMTKMMKDMAIKPSGDVDKDFVDMMVPHHQGAIDMAMAVLRYGHNERIRRLAQEIIVTQQQEIAAMRLAVGEPLPPSIASPTRTSVPCLAAGRVDRRHGACQSTEEPSPRLDP